MTITGKRLVGLFVIIAILQIASLAALLSSDIPGWVAVTLKVSLFVSIGVFIVCMRQWVRHRLQTSQS